MAIRRSASRRRVVRPPTRLQTEPGAGEEIEVMLKKVQEERMPKHAKEIVVINTETGEYVLGTCFHEACEKFRARWPKGPRYICRVDGGPALHLR